MVDNVKFCKNVAMLAFLPRNFQFPVDKNIRFVGFETSKNGQKLKSKNEITLKDETFRIVS